MLQRLREEGNGNGWKTVVENGKERERNEESLLICDHFMHSSIEKERRLLDEKRVKWIARRMEMITKETKERFQGEMGVEYRVNKQAAEKKPAAKLSEKIEKQLVWEQWVMELMLLYEVMEWERLFWNKLKALLDQIGHDRVEVKERLTREWRADCWKRLNPQKHAAEKRLADKNVLDFVSQRWASSINRFFDGVEHLNSISLREDIMQERRYPLYVSRPRIENELGGIEFRLKRGF